MTNGNEPINAVIEVDKVGNPVKKHLGLTKREYFAAMAMQGLRANNKLMLTAEDAAIQACNDADALITQLNKPTTHE